MKRLFSTLTALILLAFASSSTATLPPDGGVFLRNDQVIGAEIQVNNVDTSLNVYIQVLAAAWDGGSSALLPSLSPSFAPLIQLGTANNVFSANTASGFEGTFNNGSGKAPVGTGGNSQFQIIAWIGSPGETFAQASIKGQSAVFGQVTGLAADPSAVPPTTGIPVLLNLPLAKIALVPEPSTIALGVLGGLGLLLRRRK